MSDSDFVPNTSSDSNSETDTSITDAPLPVICLNFMDTLKPTDLSELDITVYEMVDEYINEHILTMADPDFHTTLVDTITDILFEQWEDAQLCMNKDYDDIRELIEFSIDDYFEIHNICIENIPPIRSHKTSLILHEQDKKSAKITEQIEALKSIEQPAQRTPEWYEFRHNLITASNLGKIFGSDALLNSLIYEKCKPFEPMDTTATSNNVYNVNTASPMHWGQKYEPVSLMIYEHMYSTTVGADFGCIRHPTISCIGASPDGINIDTGSERYGRMVEIKNIVNRDMDGIPSKAYWIQMQMQMETCDLDECDFWETQIKEYSDNGSSEGSSEKSSENIKEDAFWADTVHEYKGIVLYFVERVSIGSYVQGQQIVNAPHYEYMPLSISLSGDRQLVDKWIETKRQELRRKYSLYTTLYWYLEDWSCVLVERNRLWFAAARTKIEQTWEIILRERENGYEHRAAKKRIVKTIATELLVVTGEEGTTSHYIRNLPLSNSICLIKLDHDDK